MGTPTFSVNNAQSPNQMLEGINYETERDQLNATVSEMIINPLNVENSN